jgi:hypothetical protein
MDTVVLTASGNRRRPVAHEQLRVEDGASPTGHVVENVVGALVEHGAVGRVRVHAGGVRVACSCAVEHGRCTAGLVRPVTHALCHAEVQSSWARHEHGSAICTRVIRATVARVCVQIGRAGIGGVRTREHRCTSDHIHFYTNETSTQYILSNTPYLDQTSMMAPLNELTKRTAK